MDSLYTVTAEKIFSLTEYLEEKLITIDDDVENLHQVRVASRRIRTALPILKDKIGKERYRKLLAGIREITRSFGPARDLDVQILYLQEEAKFFPDVAALLEDRKIKRARLDNFTKKTAYKIIGGSFLKNTRKMCEEVLSQKYLHSESDFFKAYRELLFRLKTVLEHEKTLDDPENRVGHHTLRIAIKKLRYSLENFRSIYGRDFPPILTEVKKLQTMLGNLHDLDVWSSILKEVLSGREKLESAEPLDADLVKSSLENFYSRLSEKRSVEFQKFLLEWANLKKDDFFESILEVSSEDLKVPEFFVKSSKIQDLGGLPQGQPEDFFLLKKLEDYGIDPCHSKNVAQLSLELFDRLKELHKLEELERRYLKFASILHDIGWPNGMKAHHKNSMKRIMGDSELPLNTYERMLIGNIARYHRKSLKGSHWNYKILDKKSKRTVKKLSALLRIADALDLDGKYTYREFDLQVLKNKVKLIFPEKPIKEVLDRIEKKRDLFEEVYEKNLEVCY